MITRRLIAMVFVASCAVAMAGSAEPEPMSWQQHNTLWIEANRTPERREAVLDEILGVFDGTRILQSTERPRGYTSTEDVLLYVVRAINDEATTRRALECLMDVDTGQTLAGVDSGRTWRIATEFAWRFHCLDEYIVLMRLGKERGYPISRLQQWIEASREVPATFVEHGTTMHMRLSALRASIQERQDRVPDGDLWDEWITCLLEAKRIRDARRK